MVEEVENKYVLEQQSYSIIQIIFPATIPLDPALWVVGLYVCVMMLWPEIHLELQINKPKLIIVLLEIKVRRHSYLFQNILYNLQTKRTVLT